MKVTLTNLIPSPSFEGTGWSGGAYSTEYALVGSRSIRLDATAAIPEITTRTNNTIALNPSHTYYARVYSYQETAVGTCGFYWPIAKPSFQEGLPVGPAGQWNMHSAVNTRPSFSAGSYALRLDFNNAYVAGSIWFDGCMLIDLTAAFGVGSEPSQDWCDRNILFFEGTQQIEVYEVETISFSNAVITPNPVNAGRAFTLRINVDEIAALMYPSYLYAHEFYAGEE